MKNINTKKVVAGALALTAGAAFLATGFAAQVTGDLNPVVKGDVISATGLPAATIVVGSMAQPADVVYAGNIAAAIGSKAYTMGGATGGAVTGNVVVEVGTTSTSSTLVEGAGELKDDIAITQTATNFSMALTNSDFTKLYDDDVTGKIEGDNSYEIRLTETLNITNAQTLFSSNKDVEDFMMLVEKDDIIYKTEFEGLGLPISDGESDDYFDSDSSLDMYFMGTKYQIQSVSSSGTKVTLVGSGSTQAYNTGDTVAVTGTDDTAYTIEVGNAYNSGNKIQLKLMSGSTMLASQTFEQNDEVEFNGYTLNESISVSEILDDTSNANNDMVQLSIGTGSLLVLENNKVLPGYKDGSKDLWKVTVDGDVNHLRYITVKNNDARWDKEDKDDDKAGLIIGDKIELPLGLGNIEFTGLTVENLYDLEIGDNEVNWQDDQGRRHSIPMYEDDVADSSITIDGQDYYFDMISDTNLTVRKGTDDQDPALSAGTTNVTVNSAFTEITLLGSNDVPLYYKAYFNGGDLHLALAPKDSDKYELGKSSSTTWEFIGTVADYNAGAIETVGTKTYFDAVNTTSDDDETAIFKVLDADGNRTYVFVDPHTKDLAIKDDYDTTGTFYAQAYYDLDANITNGTNWKLDQDDAANDMAEAYTNAGMKVTVDGASAMIVAPQDPLKLSVLVGSEDAQTVTSMENATEFTFGAIGQQTEDGVTVKLVSMPSATGGQAIVPATGFDAKNLVKLDTQGAGGAKIIVGGHLVNNLAKGVTDDYLAQAGQWMLGKDAVSGNIVVAGFTAEDTKVAANALIDIIMG